MMLCIVVLRCVVGDLSDLFELFQILHYLLLHWNLRLGLIIFLLLHKLELFFSIFINLLGHVYSLLLSHLMLSVHND